eukprot:COSAG06_NODE_349_length_16992_cov_9.318712_1_plen_31_part_10
MNGARAGGARDGPRSEVKLPVVCMGRGGWHR